MKADIIIKKYATKRNMIIAGAVLVAGVFTLVITKKRREAKKLGEPDPGVMGALSSVVAAKPTSSTWPLKVGTGKNQGEKSLVGNVQRYLNRFASPPAVITLKIDGLFGPKTVARLQEAEGVSTVNKALYNKMISSLTGVKI